MMTGHNLDSAPKDVLLHLSLVRHGETACSQSGVYCGRHCDPSLTLEGRKMAEALGVQLLSTPWHALYTSPLVRAQQTVWPLAQATRLEPTLVPGLAELDYGDWDGAHKQALQNRAPEAFAAWQASPSCIAPPGGETVQMLWRRTSRALMHIIETHSAERAAGQQAKHVLVVAHKSTLRVALCGLLRLNLDCFRQRFAWPLGAVARLDWTACGPQIVHLADASDPHPAAPPAPGQASGT